MTCDLVKEIENIGVLAEQALMDSYENTLPLREMVFLPAGIFVLPNTLRLPTLSETTGRIHPLGLGLGHFSALSFYGPFGPVIPMPAVWESVEKIHVTLNGANLLFGEDYSLAGSILTLTAAVEQGDELMIYGYGI